MAEAESFLSRRYSDLSAVLACWGEAGPDELPLGAAMRESARTLGMAPTMQLWWLAAEGLETTGTVHELFSAARGLDEGIITLDQAIALMRRPEVTDLHRLVAVLYACARSDSRTDGLDLVMLRLAADTASDDEFSGRCYLRLGELAGQDAMYAANSFSHGINRVVESGPPALQAALLLGLARCAFRMGRWEDASENARVARLVYTRSGDTGGAEGAALLEAMSLLEKGEPAMAADAIRPVVLDQKAHGVREGFHDASPVLRRAVQDAARPAFELAMKGDPRCVDVYDAALALAGDTGCGMSDEAGHRRLLALRLVRSGFVDEGQRQFRQAAALDGGETPSKLETRLVQATSHMQAGNFAAAHQALQPVLEEAQCEGVFHVELAAAYALGECALMEGRHEKALELLDSVAAKSKDVQPQIHARALNMIGSIHSVGLRRPDVGLSWHEAAAEEQRALGDFDGLVVSSVQAALACVELMRLDEAERHAAEVARLGPAHPPPDVEWVTAVPALVAALRGRWPEAKAGFRATIGELERRRREFATAEEQRLWAANKADFYGQAIDAAIVSGDEEEALRWFELARNRYLDAVVREPSGRPDTLGADLQVPGSLRDALPADTALVWCGAFPRGLGILAARREDGEPTLRCSFHADIASSQLQALFHGQAGQLLRAADEGRAVEAIAEMVREDAQTPMYGTHAFWQARGPEWARSLAQVVEVLRQTLWPRVLEAVGGSVPRIVLLPSVGCTELPLAAAAPDRWPDGTPLGVSFAPSLSTLLRPARTGPPASLLQVENPSEDESLACCTVEAAATRALFAGEARVLRGRRAP